MRLRRFLTTEPILLSYLSSQGTDTELTMWFSFVLQEFSSPRSFVSIPKIFQQVLLFESIHRLTKTIVFVSCKHSLLNQSLHWLNFQDGIITLNKVTNFSPHIEISAVYPFIQRFFNKFLDIFAIWRSSN